jgi:hypothetical protein
MVCKTVEQIYEMSGALKNQKILSAILRIVTHPASQNFAHLQRARSCRTFATAIPRRVPSGFSVSFAPEPDELETKAPAPSKAPAEKAKSKTKPVKKAKSKEKQVTKAELAHGVKTQEEREDTSEHASKELPDHAAAVAILNRSATNPQNQETHVHAEQADDTATGDISVADPDHKNAVKLGLEDDLLIADGLTTESFDSEDHLRAALGGAEGHAKTTPGDFRPAAVKKQGNSETIVGSGFFLDDNPIKPQAPFKLAPTASQPTPKGARKEKRGSLHSRSSSTQETSLSFEQKSTSEGSKVDPKPKTNVQAKSPRPALPKKEPWQAQKQALQNKFGTEGWNPRKKLSPDTIDGIRALHEQYPDKYPTPVLAEKFKVSPEAIRRILKSKWRPDPDKQFERKERWARRHDRIWDQQAAIGLRPARTKVKKQTEPGDVDENVEIEEFQVARARKQTRDMHLTHES